MFADLKNDYKDISTAEYSKWIENWLVTLADLVEEENNFDDTLEETNEHFLKVCGKVYKPVGYSFNYFNCCKGKITIYSGSENYMTYKVYYNGGDDKEIWLYTHPQEYEFSGNRIHRGMYKTKDGITFNADVNGALNILRKSSVVSLETLYGRGDVDTPIRIRVS